MKRITFVRTIFWQSSVWENQFWKRVELCLHSKSWIQSCENFSFKIWSLLNIIEVDLKTKYETQASQGLWTCPCTVLCNRNLEYHTQPGCRSTFLSAVVLRRKSPNKVRDAWAQLWIVFSWTLPCHWFETHWEFYFYD